MLVGNKLELSRIPRSRFFLAVSSSSLFVCHMLPWIHPSALSIKDFYFCCYCDCLYLQAFSFGCLSFTAHSTWGKPTGGRLEKQDINLTSWVYSFVVWSDFMRRKHMVVEERNCWGVNVSFEMPLLASWQGRKKERKKKKNQTMEDLLRHSDEKEARADFLAESWILPCHVEVSFHRGHISPGALRSITECLLSQIESLIISGATSERVN